jgi:hypothetical protein
MKPIKFSELTYITPEEFLAYESLSVTGLYARKAIPTDNDDLIASLLTDNGQYQILSPIVIGTYQGVEYIVNGNTRQHIAKNIPEKFLPIPVLKIVDELSEELLTRLQFVFNDTTRSHDTFQRYLFLAEKINAYNELHPRAKVRLISSGWGFLKSF